MRKLILIGGVGRSGTTLARKIIGSHSRIAIPPTELKIFNYIARGRSVRECLSRERLTAWGIDFSDLYPLPPKEAFSRLLERYREKAGKDIAGEKSTFYEFFYTDLREWFAGIDLKFVHIVRNPYDVAASYKHFYKGRTRDISSFIIDWKRSAFLATARAHLLPGQYFLLKYEDLIEKPFVTAENLCDFLGIEREPERMLNFHDYDADYDRKLTKMTSFEGEGQVNVQKTLLYQSKSRRDYLTKDELAYIDRVCGEQAEALGYVESARAGGSPHRLPDSLAPRTPLERLLRRANRVFLKSRIALP